MFSKNTIDFLKNIKLNNNRDWMASHQKEYASAKNDFFNMVEKILIEMKKKDQSYESTLTKQCIFRLNRDVRFSKDKSPFKINFGAAIGPQGKKTQGACYYLHLEPGNSFIGGGIWMPTPNELNKILQEIDYNTEDFFKIINEKKFKKTFGDLNKESQLKKVRKGFETNRKAAEYLKLKSFTVMKNILDEECMNESVFTTILNSIEIMAPFIQFMNQSIKE